MSIIWIIAFFGVANTYEIFSNHDAMMYLNRFGYIEDEDMTDNSDMSMSAMKPILMEFQKVCNINQTGVLDSKTMQMMNAPRCGNLDMNLTGHHTMFLNDLDVENKVVPDRYRRFAINENRLQWKKRELTYKMGMFSQKMGAHVSQNVVLEQIHTAFKLWSEVTNLDFIYRPSDKKVDIELSFTMRFHVQDQYPFDGPGKTLAHAFPPGDGVLGDVHFEDEENWTVNTPSGVNILFVAVHEIGHALGLSHSKAKGAIMQPFYAGYSPKLRLHPDDIDGIQSLYGKRDGRKITTTDSSTSKPTRPRPTTPKPPPPTTATTSIKVRNGRPDLCKDSKIDAITTLNDGTIVAFKGDYVFQIDDKGKGIVSGSPNRIETVFKGLEGNLDAAVTRKNGKTYFFKGPYYWRFVDTEMSPGYPKKISVHFRGIPDNVDSAFAWLNAIYFTKGDKIWRFDPSSRPFISDKYPISLGLWELGPTISKIDASFKAPNGHVYFFYDQTYWRFDERRFKADFIIFSNDLTYVYHEAKKYLNSDCIKVNNDLSPPYPRSSKVFWFGCSKAVPVDYRNIRQPVLSDSYNDYIADDNQPFNNFY